MFNEIVHAPVWRMTCDDDNDSGLCDWIPSGSGRPWDVKLYSPYHFARLGLASWYRVDLSRLLAIHVSSVVTHAAQRSLHSIGYLTHVHPVPHW